MTKNLRQYEQSGGDMEVAATAEFDSVRQYKRAVMCYRAMRDISDPRKMVETVRDLVDAFDDEEEIVELIEKLRGIVYPK